MQYVVKKTGVLIVTLLLVSLLAFLAFQIIPGDPTTMLLGTEYSPERAEALREELISRLGEALDERRDNALAREAVRRLMFVERIRRDLEGGKE
jgi:ABC-type microcin C transport system permease subunit YejB